MLLESFKEKLDVKYKQFLTQEDLVGDEAVIWEAEAFDGEPVFYPVYRWENFYSHSVLALILHKGCFSPNDSVMSLVEKSQFQYLPTNETVDKDIVRLGKPKAFVPEVTCPKQFANKVVLALKKDIAEAEARYVGRRHVVLCGGKDSLNLLLLPWQEPPLVVSAAPNYELVKAFVVENKLNNEVLRLEDFEDDDVLEFEVLENACRANLEHWRWGAHLLQLSKESDQKLVFWKGQLGDIYMTDKWKAVTNPNTGLKPLVFKVYKRLEGFVPNVVKRAIFNRIILPEVTRSIWYRSAMLQGAHVGFLKSLTGNVVVSAYHGVHVIELFHRLDLFLAAQYDIRSMIGEQLLGRKVIYPSQNPGPGPSLFRSGIHRPDVFVKHLELLGVKVSR